MVKKIACVLLLATVIACGDNVPAQDSSVPDSAIGVSASALTAYGFSRSDPAWSFAEIDSGINHVPGLAPTYWGIPVSDELIYSPPVGPAQITTYGSTVDTLPHCTLQLTEFAGSPAGVAKLFPDWFGTRTGLPRLADRNQQRWAAYIMRHKYAGSHPNDSTCRWFDGYNNVPVDDVVVIRSSGTDPDTYVMIQSHSGGLAYYAYMSFR